MKKFTSYRSLAECKMAIHLKEENIEFIHDYKFLKDRKFLIDFALLKYKIGIEVEGITKEGGRHQRMVGFMNDCEKYNLAAKEGWKILRIPAPWLMTCAYFPRFNQFIENLKSMIMSSSSSGVLVFSLEEKGNNKD